LQLSAKMVNERGSYRVCMAVMPSGGWETVRFGRVNALPNCLLRLFII